MKKVIKFSSESCAPCKAYAPVFGKWVNSVNGLLVEMVDVEESPAEASRYRIMSVPTTLFFEDDRLISSKVGPLTKEELNEVFK